MLRFLSGWGPSRKSSKRENLDDELNQTLPYSAARTTSSRSYKTSPSQISISAPIPRSSTSLTGYDNPYLSPSGSGNNDVYQFRQPSSSLTRLGASLNPASSSSTSVGRASYGAKSHHAFPYHLPSPPLSDGGSELASSINDGPLPAVIRIETDGLQSRKSKPDSRGMPSPPSAHSEAASSPGTRAAAPSKPVPVRRTVSSPPTPTTPYHSSPAESSSSPSSSELTPTFGAPTSSAHLHNTLPGRVNLKLHTSNHIYSQSTQSLPTSSSPMGNAAASGSGFRGVGMHSDPSLAYTEGNADAFAFAYSYPLVKQLSPIAEQDYFSPDSLKRPKSLPPSGSASRTNSDKELRESGRESQAGSLSRAGSLTHSGSPIGSQTSEITRPSPIYASPFISRPLNRTASQGSSRTHVSATSSAARPCSAAKSDSTPPVIPPLDLRPSFLGPHSNSQPSPTGSGRIRSSKFSNTLPSILGSMEGADEDDYDYAGTTESLHAESFVTASDHDDGGRPRRGNSVKDIETVDKESFRRNGRPGGQHVGGGVDAASVRSSNSRVMPPSASESFITRRWDRDVALGPGVPTFRAKKQWINVTPAFWAFWVGFLCPFLWLVGGWHFTNFGEQPPRLTFWEFYFNTGYCKELFCGRRNKKREMDHLRREGKRVAPPPLPRWVSEKQSSELGRARLNDPKRSLKGISFGYPFIPRPVPVYRDESFLRTLAQRMVGILGKPNRIFDQLYGIRLREVRGRPEGPRRMFDPWIQRCRYALCYAMLFLAIGLLAASTYLIVYNTRKL
ncbi:hypothetical protein DFP72DRAFT_850530 [Ephemerocybe angulata]|uniref:Uncharacterized protein n=1 Tax=Ephemerocybe angulata TaxID=980116 RepID=A0A8H6HR76_9AGAR|nr:hypothetical protein DFP72DRAFT_850530 [Tulosesus angulatus]